MLPATVSGVYALYRTPFVRRSVTASFSQLTLFFGITSDL